MARKQKSVYERIKDKKQEVLKAEEVLNKLNNELQDLFAEKDKFEMKQLLDHIKAKNLNLEQAIDLLNR